MALCSARELGPLVIAQRGWLAATMLEERRYQETELVAMQNLVAALFRLENSRTPEDIAHVVAALIEWLRNAD